MPCCLAVLLGGVPVDHFHFCHAVWQSAGPLLLLSPFTLLTGSIAFTFATRFHFCRLLCSLGFLFASPAMLLGVPVNHFCFRSLLDWFVVCITCHRFGAIALLALVRRSFSPLLWLFRLSLLLLLALMSLSRLCCYFGATAWNTARTAVTRAFWVEFSVEESNWLFHFEWNPYGNISVVLVNIWFWIFWRIILYTTSVCNSTEKYYLGGISMIMYL